MFRRIRFMGKTTFVTLNVLAVIAILLAYLATHISPEIAPILALFGIGYGILLVINLLFIVFWLLVKKRLALISAVAILIGYNHLSAYIRLIPIQPDPSGESVKVVSQNVKLFSWYNWRNNISDRDEMLANLQEAEGDIYCFQEYFHHSSPGVFDTQNNLRETLGTPYMHIEYTATVQGDQHYGIATFSKFPIVRKGRISFPGEHGNTCIYSDIAVNGDTLRVYNAHVASIRFSDADYRFLKDLQDQNERIDPLINQSLNIVERLTKAYKRRAVQTRIIKKHMRESPFPVVVCGDLNDTPVSYSYARISEGLVDAFRESGWGIGNTYIGTFPSFRIDYILHSPKWGSFDYHTLEESISDHHAISCRLYKKPD